MQFASLTNEDSTMILIGLYDIAYDFHQALLHKLPPSLPSPDQVHPPTKRTKLPLVMLVTLMLFKFFVGHRSWKEYFRYLKSHHHAVNVGFLPNYQNFMNSMHKVVRGLAAKSKGTMGWYYGFKLHLVCDIHGQILACPLAALKRDT